MAHLLATSVLNDLCTDCMGVGSKSWTEAKAHIASSICWIVTNVRRTALNNLLLRLILQQVHVKVSGTPSSPVYVLGTHTPYANTVALRTLSPPSGRWRENLTLTHCFNPVQGCVICELHGCDTSNKGGVKTTSVFCLQLFACLKTSEIIFF